MSVQEEKKKSKINKRPWHLHSIFNYILSWNPKDVQWLHKLRHTVNHVDSNSVYCIKARWGDDLFNDNAI